MVLRFVLGLQLCPVMFCLFSSPCHSSSVLSFVLAHCFVFVSFLAVWRRSWTPFARRRAFNYWLLCLPVLVYHRVYSTKTLRKVLSWLGSSVAYCLTTSYVLDNFALCLVFSSFIFVVVFVLCS